MSTMTLTSRVAPARMRIRRLRLTAGTPAAADAAAAIRDVIGEWRVPVDRALAAMLASDLLINAAVTGTPRSLMLVVRCAGRRFRVEIHDASVCGDSRESTVPGPQSQRGLLLAAICAAASGCYRTPTGRAVFYELEFAPPDAATGGGTSRGRRGDGEP